MTSPLFYSAFLGALLSSIGIGLLALKGHNPNEPKTVSRVVVKDSAALAQFRATIFVGGTLIAASVFFLIVPRTDYGIQLSIGFALVYASELLLSIFPAKHNTNRLHTFFAKTMGVGMFGTTVLLTLKLTGNAWVIEALIALVMVALIIAGVLHSKKVIVYELVFILMSHISILVAMLSVSR